MSTITINNIEIPANMTKEEITALVTANVPEKKKKVMETLRAFGVSTSASLQMKEADKIKFISEKYAEMSKGAKKAAPATATKVSVAPKVATKGPAKKTEPEPETEEPEEEAPSTEAAADGEAVEALKAQVTDLKEALDSATSRLSTIETVLLELHMTTMVIAAANGWDADALKEVKDQYYGKLITVEEEEGND